MALFVNVPLVLFFVVAVAGPVSMFGHSTNTKWQMREEAGTSKWFGKCCGKFFLLFFLINMRTHITKGDFKM